MGRDDGGGNGSTNGVCVCVHVGVYSCLHIYCTCKHSESSPASGQLHKTVKTGDEMVERPESKV